MEPEQNKVGTNIYLKKNTIPLLVFLFLIIIIGSLILISSYRFVLKAPQNKNASLTGLSSNNFSPNNIESAKKSCGYTGMLQKMTYVKLSDIVSNQYFAKQYEKWQKIENDPVTFQAYVPTYYKHVVSYGESSFDIQHPIYGKYSLSSIYMFVGSPSNTEGWSGIEKNLCELAELNHISKNPSDYEYYDADYSVNKIMISQDGRSVVLLDLYSGRYWALTLISQSAIPNYATTSLREKYLIKDPDFIGFLRSINFIFSPPNQ